MTATWSAGLPSGFSARTPDEGDLPDLLALLTTQRLPQDKPVDVDGVTANLLGPGSWTRRQRVVRDEAGALTGWVSVHDRAAGRTDVELLVAEAPTETLLAEALLAWAGETAAAVARLRGAAATLATVTTAATDSRTQAWLTAAGYRQVRDWLHMLRPVTADDPQPLPRPGVVVRRVRAHADGLPVAEDVQTVHQLLEESFADHFHSYRESFGEFVQRLREDPWHRWDHWWIASVEVDGRPQPGGALISSVSPADRHGRYGSYIDYIGVHRRARGRGVAKELLRTVVADTAERGRSWVGLEVDADSPTGADGLYRSLGWQVDHITESWHLDVPAAPPD